MKVEEFFTAENKTYWLGQIAKSDWSAGRHLAQLLCDGKLKEVLGETAQVLMLTDGDALVSFCTLAPLDDIQPTELSPWVGFVYTFPAYRGNRYAGRLLAHAERLAAAMGEEAVYISTDHTGLYEKYGYGFYRTARDLRGGETRIYRKVLPAGQMQDSTGSHGCRE